MALREWLILIRLPSAAIGVAVPIAAYLLAVHEAPSAWSMISYGVFGWLFQAVGMADNQVTDYPYDLMDPNKTHFPLVAAGIRPRDAELFVKTVLVLLLILGAWLSAGKAPALLSLLVCAVLGLIYNHYNKTKLWTPIVLAVSFAMLPLYVYFSVGVQLSTLLILSNTYFFLFTAYQVAITGELKDLETNERSFLRILGCRIENNYFSASPTVLGYAISLKMLGLLVVLVIASTTGAFVECIALTIPIVIAVGLSVRSGQWNREGRLKSMLLVEILSYCILLISVLPVIGTTQALLLVLIPFAFSALVNRILYGEITPKF